MNPRVAALLDEVRERANQHVGALFAAMNVREQFGDELARLTDEPIALGEHGNRYEVWIVQAQLARIVIPGKPKLHFALALFWPVGELGQRRERALARGGDVYEAFFRDMAVDLIPSMPDVDAVLGELSDVLAQVCSGARYAPLTITTTGAFELVAVFVDVESLRSLALEVGRN